MTVLRTHFLTLRDGSSALDPSCLILALASRGKVVLAGAAYRDDRDELAALLKEGLLAELLASERPIRVDSHVAGYIFEEVP